MILRLEYSQHQTTVSHSEVEFSEIVHCPLKNQKKITDEHTVLSQFTRFVNSIKQKCVNLHIKV